ncbi:RNA-directed DNA polymerase-like protein [Gossypium australe]|uniref:RNA-directed DNA polymerase-like protein n=1 Tax=Gossypium australe TaxID=47621 RepID=A0A5B6VD20_9ROSI|nr:RNA-directed DNA polymerase-like protein [Gossypium australe]
MVISRYARLDVSIVEHRFPLKPNCKPIYQNLKLLKIKEEINKQFDARFLEVTKYPEWVVNIVLVPKKYGKIRMYVDYRDLNRDSPKNNFPLLFINTLVDSATRHCTFSFLDAFLRDNQIKMAKEDMEKTTIIMM